MTIRTVSPPLERFLHWKATATPGQRHEYYRGYLGEVVGERGDLADEVRMINTSSQIGARNDQEN